MPSRLLLLLILAGWLATVSYFFHRELWPYLRPGQPPPYSINLADETTIQQTGVWRWTIYRVPERGEPVKVGRAATSLRYHNEDDTFELVNEVTSFEMFKAVSILVPRQVTVTRVSREGFLREISTGAYLEVFSLPVWISVELTPGPGGLTRTCRAGLGPKVSDPLSLELPKIIDELKRLVAQGHAAEVTLEPIPVPEGSVLSPLQPVNRINGLRPGRHWQAPLVDPLGVAFKSALPQLFQKLTQGQLGPGEVPKISFPEGPSTLAAEVKPQTEVLTWNREPQECYVIEHRGGDFAATTWVRARDGLVLLQEASQSGGEKLRLLRD